MIHLLKFMMPANLMATS